jgi:hypothetical protein
MDEKIFEFKTTIFGIEKNFRVYAENAQEARKKLDKRVLDNVIVNEYKDVTPNKGFSMKDMFDEFGKIFGESGIFGGKKK